MKTYDNYAVADAIERYIHSKRDREMLKRHLIDNDSIVTLADDYDLTYRRAWDIINDGRNVISEYVELQNYVSCETTA